MMLNIMTPLLALAILMPTQVFARSEADIQAAATLGGPHGKGFDDIDMIKAKHLRLRKITLSPCETGAPLTYVSFEYAFSTNKKAPTTHFSEHGTLQPGKQTRSIELSDSEYIMSYKGWNRKVNIGLTSKTRLGALKFTTSRGQVAGCGVAQIGREPQEVFAPDKRAFLYFSGAAGDVIDNLTGHTIPSKDYM